MNTDQINYIRHRLQRYEESITETEEHFEQLECFGSFRACAPCYEKFGIPILIDALKTDSDKCEIFWQEYDRITKKLNGFEANKGHFYRDLLYTDLKKYVAAYHAALCYMNLNVIAMESNHDLVNREAIRALLSELRRDHDTEDIEKLVVALDETFLDMSEPMNEHSAKKIQISDGVLYTPHTACDEYQFACREKEQTRFF
jgi:hypothetical protein